MPDSKNDEEYSYWVVNYISCEGNERWGHYRCPASWTQYDVEVRAQASCGGCGDDMAEIVSVEETNEAGPAGMGIYHDWKEK